MSVNSSNSRFQAETSTPRFQTVVCVIFTQEKKTSNTVNLVITKDEWIIFDEKR